MDNIINLHQDLKSFNYRHGNYRAFNINDPKPRSIHKANVRDRLLHHAIYRILYPFFDRIFVADSFSCRLRKGTHKGLKRLNSFYHKASENRKKTVWVLKCDIRKFFENIDHAILIKVAGKYVPDKNIIWLLREVVSSFSSKSNKGLTLGNLTSQLLVNIYMNEFDQFVKHKLKAKYYIRYADDFIVLSQDKAWLEELLPKMGDFLGEITKLNLHPDKVSIKTITSGVDFLGWVHFSDHKVLRTTTKRRMFKRIKKNYAPEVVNSYLGLLKHGNTHKIKKMIVSN